MRTRVRTSFCVILLGCCVTAAWGQAGSGLVINEFMADNTKTITDKYGKNSDWIELYNRSSSPIVLTNWYLRSGNSPLVFEQWPFCTNSAVTNIGPGKYLVVFASGKNDSAPASELHTNFKLGASGEYLALVQGTNVVSAYDPVFPPQYPDVSYGIGPGGTLMYFSPATPGATNTGGILGVTDDCIFSPPSCLFTSSVLVTATSTTAGAMIRFTTNSDPPTALSTQYIGQITLSNSIVLRATATKPTYNASRISTYTYISLPDVLKQPVNPPGWTNSWSGLGAADYEMDPVVVSNNLSLMTNALKVLPSVSLVTSKSNLFDPSYGIYVNGGAQSLLWERPASAEWVGTNGTDAFKADCGVRIQGGAGRGYKKHSFRLLFKSIYGPAQIDAALFDGPRVTSSFDTFILRAGWNDAYSGGTHLYFLDECTRRTQVAEGVPGSHGTFVHLYLDGLYWGLYNAAEKPDQSFGATYFGGNKTNYDVIAIGEAIEGDVNAWNQLITLCQSSGLVTNELYQRIQGNNPDRTRNPAYPDYIDVDNYIDYLMPRQWMGDWDWPWNNWHAMRNRDSAASGGFRFVIWDGEGWNFGANKVEPGAGGMNSGAGIPYCSFLTNAEFRLLFADHIYKHYFNGGALTTNQMIPRYTNLAAIVEPAVMAENARWGGSGYTLESWRGERDNWLSQIPSRTATVLQQYKTQGLYPAIDPPVFSQRSRLFTNSLALTLTSTNTVYYTLDGSDPREYGTGKAIGMPYGSGPLAISNTLYVTTRAMVTTNLWSAIDHALFIKAATTPRLRITEVMYNPRVPSAAETNRGWAADDFQFVEVKNNGSETIGLAGTKFTDGVMFDFTGSPVTTLASGEYALVVKNITAFTNRYPALSSRIAGAFQTTYDFPQSVLSHKGEKITLVDATNNILSTFTYDSGRGWPTAADGAGHSLVPLPSMMQDQINGALDYCGNWRASSYVDGSPGKTDPDPVNDVKMNEVMAHTRYSGGPLWQTSNDWIELFNATSNSLIVATNWYLSDDSANLKKWAIPSNNIPSSNLLTLFEVGGFHQATNIGFGINEDGEQVYLSYLPGNTNDRVADCVRFKAQETNRAWGRYPDGGTYWYTTMPTTNVVNFPATQSVVISEIMYHPPTNAAYPVDNGFNEYVELFNPGSQSIALTNAAGAYRLDGGISFTFPTNAIIPAGGYMVAVSFDPSTNSPSLTGFLNSYWLTNGQVRMAGPYSGRLSDHGDRVAVERPQFAELTGDPLAWVIVDEVIYFDQLPWPDNCDGTSNSLRRLLASTSGDDPANWIGSMPTPGQSPVKLTLVKPDSGSAVFAPASVTFTALIDSNQVAGSVSRVEFWEGTTLLNTAYAGPYKYVWNANAIGTYQFWARMIDAAGTNDSLHYAIGVLSLVNGGVSNIMDTCADISGTLVGGLEADVYMCWGRTDKGTDRWGWEFWTQIGQMSAGSFSVHATGVSPGTCYYRCYAKAGGNEGWAPATTNFTASFVNWNMKMKIGFPWYKNSEVLTNFPVLVVLQTNTPGFRYADFSTSDGRDLRFGNYGVTEALNYEIEKWNTNGASYVWVRVPEFRAGTSIWATWGNSWATNPSPWSAHGSVWGDEYGLVLHMTNSGGYVDDSSLNARKAAVSQGTFSNVSGQVGAAIGTGSSRTNRVVIDQDDRIALGEEWTISAWFRNLMDWTSSRVLAAGDSGDAVMVVQTRKTVIGVLAGTNFYSAAANLTSTSAWCHVTAVGRGTTTQIYLDSVLVGQAAYKSTNDIRYLGNNASNDNKFAYDLDEYRIERKARSANWIQARWVNETSNSVFVSNSIAMPSGNGDYNSNGMPDWWEVEYFGGTNTLEGGAEGDWDTDGVNNRDEWVAGTDPVDPTSYLRIRLTRTNIQALVGFDMMSVSGPWYGGRDRYYDLQSSTGLLGWAGVADLTNIHAETRPVVFTNTQTDSAMFYRVKARLVP